MLSRLTELLTMSVCGDGVLPCCHGACLFTWGPCVCALCVQVPVCIGMHGCDADVTSQMPSILFSETGSLPGLELTN